MSTTIGKYWFSEVDLDNITVIDEGILEDVCKLYSNDFGVWADTGNKITLTPKKFLGLHKHEVVYFVSNRNGDIIGFFSVFTKQQYMIKVITSGCVKSEYRDQGIATSLLEYVLSKIHEGGRWRIGCVTPNPVLLLTLESYPGLEYIDLEDEVASDVSFGIQLSIFIDEFRRKSYALRSGRYKKAEEISYKKIDTGFSPEVLEADIKDGLLEFYQNLMGKLGPDEEWILFCKYEPKFDNTIRKEIRE